MDIKNTLLEDIGAEIGYTATSALCGWYGGRDLHIPRNFAPDHKIAKVIGPQAFARLCAAFGGGNFHIPKDRAQKLIRRDRIVCDMLLRGASTSDVMSRLRISATYVWKIRHSLEASGLLPLILTTPPERDDAC